MRDNPLLKLQSFGQSIWLDYLRRGMIDSGEMERLIREDGLRGNTSNPSIFQKSIVGSHDYDGAIRALALEGKSVDEIYQALTVEDVRRTADLYRELYDASDGRHGFVSLEVNPHLARDTEGTMKEARRLWKAVDRPNVFIKVPATKEGLPAIRRLIAEGINVNVTLLFGLPRYREVAESYIAGIEDRIERGEPVDRIASVASFFLSRIDVLVDPVLEKILDAGGPRSETAAELRGRVAVASAKIAYRTYKEVFKGDRFGKLAATGVRAQRVLWASTSTKNPAYSDVKYVEALIGPETINTVPTETLNAYRDHGDPAPRLEEGADAAAGVLDRLADLDVDIDKVTQQLEDEGIEKFNGPYDSLLETLKKKMSETLKEPVDRQSFDGGAYGRYVGNRLREVGSKRWCHRLWRKETTVWKSEPEHREVIGKSLGWLHVAEKMEEKMRDLAGFASDVRAAGFWRVIHMGMGGSSLAPLVFQRTFGRSEDGLPVTVLDTTDPAAVQSIEKAGPLEKTLFIVASKSGTTAEPLAFRDYFFERVLSVKGSAAGENFVAITDPGTPLEDQSRGMRFRRIFLNFKDIGGRYSALSYFGLVPAALMGIDVGELLERSLRMAHACGSCVPIDQNPGAVLGAVLGECALRGRDKVTFLLPPELASLGMWMEQLLAESTGKEGTGLIPVTGEQIGKPDSYGDDRLFVRFRLKDKEDPAMERKLSLLRENGHPVVNLLMEDRLDIGQEFFRWEIAVAIAGAILGIDPFDQPNVQESKDNTNRLLERVRTKGGLPEERPALSEKGLILYGGGKANDAAGLLGRFLADVRPRDYVALLAYITENDGHEKALQAIRALIHDRLHMAVTAGYGPRYLHSTGQLHKGGPNSGVFILLTAEESGDVPIPERSYGFGTFKRAQALGDLEALRSHGRRVVRVHMADGADGGLKELENILRSTRMAVPV
jgi:transaldolase/glucose-6-phosphate isomerase